MKSRTKNGLWTVLLSLIFALTLCAGIWLAIPQQQSNAEAGTGLMPPYGEDTAGGGCSYIRNHAHTDYGGRSEGALQC